MNLNLPSVLTDKPPALEETHSDLIRKKLLHCMQHDRALQSESGEQIKRALKHQILTYSKKVYVPGVKACFKRKNTKRLVNVFLKKAYPVFFPCP